MENRSDRIANGTNPSQASPSNVWSSKPAGIDAVIELLARVSAAAPSLPLYYYHIAIKTGIALRCDLLLAAAAAAKARLPTFVGIKYSDADCHIFANCQHYAGGAYDVLSGKDEQLAGFLAMGGRGAIGAPVKVRRTSAESPPPLTSAIVRSPGSPVISQLANMCGCTLIRSSTCTACPVRLSSTSTLRLERSPSRRDWR